MKIKKFLVSFCLLACLFFLCSCGNTPSSNKLEDNLSEYRKNLFIYKNSSYLVTLTSGQRETDYIMNGENTKLVDFGVLTVKFNSVFAGSKLQFELKIDDDTYAGEFERNPYDGTFVYDIQKQISDDSLISLYIVDFDEKINLQCISKNWQYGYKDALQIFANNHKTEIEGIVENGKIKGEVYIKTVAEDSNLNDIYWYVLLVCKNGEMYANLISPVTGEVMQST